MISNQICFYDDVPAHFRTNIITGQCNFGGKSGCAGSDPWYYREGCGNSTKERINLMKQGHVSAVVIHECDWLCREGSERFCSDGIIGESNRDISCHDIVSCANITCD